MPHLKGPDVGGYVNIDKNVKFLRAVDIARSWSEYYYVDYDNGNDGFDGKSPTQAFKNLQKALDASTHEDVIFIRPRAPVLATGDPSHITPAVGTNWVIPSTHYGLMLIGMGAGFGRYVDLKGYALITTPTLAVRAPYVTLESLNFRRDASTAGAVKFSYADAGPDYSWGNTVYKCSFWNIGAAGDAALILESSWYSIVKKTVFNSCAIGIRIGASNSVPVGHIFEDLDFNGLAAAVDCDIYSAAVINIAMKRLYFNHAVPSLGPTNKFLAFTGASTGGIQDCYHLGATVTVATNMTLNGIGYGHIYCGPNTGLQTT